MLSALTTLGFTLKAALLSLLFLTLSGLLPADGEHRRAIIEKCDPLVTDEEGRRTVEIFTAVYRSQRDGKPVRFPLDAEDGSETYDGRLSPRK